ncbi:hypothetical protein LINGRAHAP2_LOCUS12759 [Linum grandiflorum]
MEVAIPTPATEFNFDSSCSSPYLTAPSSPLPFGSTAAANSFFSAPTSPTPAAAANRPSNSEFEFDFGGQLCRSSFSAADELFHCGKILPLRSPPDSEFATSPKKMREFDFEEESEDRGREWRIFTSCSSYNFDSDVNSSSAASSGRRGTTRSLPPMRISDVMSEQDDDEVEIGGKTKQSYAAAFLSAMKVGGGRYKKWKIRDFLLFRSASEGRATSSEQLMAAKYAVLSRRKSLPPSPAAEDVSGGKGSSFRSTTESSFGSSRRLRQSAAVSAHEMHYTVNRAAAEEMKRKTYLPYKQGLLGCLGFNPVGPDISRGIGSLTRG